MLYIHVNFLNQKQKINRFCWICGAFIGFLVFIAYIPQSRKPTRSTFAAVSYLGVTVGLREQKDWILIFLIQLESFWADLLSLPLYSKYV